MKILDAADLVAKSYGGKSKLPPVKKVINEGNVQGYLLSDGTLLLPGSDSTDDYLMTNLIVSSMKVIWQSRRGEWNNLYWHRGFVRYAQTILDGLDGDLPNFIVGHSLGGAVASMIGAVHNIPTLTFAAPRCLRDGDAPNAGSILNLANKLDGIAFLPPLWWGYRHVGRRVRMHKHPEFKHHNRHNMSAYKARIEIAIREGQLPERFP